STGKLLSLNENFDYSVPTSFTIYENHACSSTSADSLRHFGTTLCMVVYSIAFILGTTGNMLVLVILLRNRRCLRITENYLLHLALADLFLALTLPLKLVEITRGWVFGNFMCTLVSIMHKVNFHCGSILLGCIGFDRYLAIVHAVHSLRLRRVQVVHIICGVIWFLCLFISLPDAVFLSVNKGVDFNSSFLYCNFASYPDLGSYWHLISRFLANVLGFFLPLAFMTYCYLAIVTTLCRTQQSLEKHRAIRVALLVTGFFCICWVPYNVTIFLDTLYRLDVLKDNSCEEIDGRNHALIITEGIGYLHCFLNPILYAFVGVKFRHDVLRMLRDLGCLDKDTFKDLKLGDRRRISFSEGITTSGTSF
uniref:C-X-C motif chemokine receptor 5 n=1 Tax=Erpetoichthys calabaricus TaxID=27687 RepID=A0A8C4SKG5_ERPCA